MPLQVAYHGWLEHKLTEQILHKNPVSQPISQQAAEAGYHQTLENVYKVIEAANTPKTTAKRLSVAREFQAFLAQLPAPHTKNMAEAGPEDVLVFIEAVWSKQHAGSFLPGSKGPIASPQGVSGALSFLRTTFDMLGKRGPYHTSNMTGNPCECESVYRYSQGYQRSMWAQGYQESSAVPLTRVKIEVVGKQLLPLALNESVGTMDRLAAMRDITLMLFLWESSLRGREAGNLGLGDLYDCGSGLPLFPAGHFPLDSGYVGPPLKLRIRLGRGTKTNKLSRGGQEPIDLGREDHPDPGQRSEVVGLLWGFMKLCGQLGHPVTDHIFRPLNDTKNGFKSTGYSTPALSHMVRHRLEAVGLYQGETSHSFRRGSLQALEQAAGSSTSHSEVVQMAGKQARIKTPRVVNTYLDSTRHIGRTKLGKRRAYTSP